MEIGIFENKTGKKDEEAFETEINNILNRGLNEAGRKYFKRTTGANLKRPSKKVGNKRRASFCARMKGMKKKLTSSKTANDPNSRINKALRAWNC